MEGIFCRGIAVAIFANKFAHSEPVHYPRFLYECRSSCVNNHSFFGYWYSSTLSLFLDFLCFKSNKDFSQNHFFNFPDALRGCSLALTTLCSADPFRFLHGGTWESAHNILRSPIPRIASQEDYSFSFWITGWQVKDKNRYLLKHAH